MPRTDISEVRAKPRGSLSGLQKRQAQSAARTREALKRAYRVLLVEHGGDLWKKIDLARRAGLKSTVPLHADDNADVLLMFNQHNANVMAQTATLSRLKPPDGQPDLLSTAIALLDAEVVEARRENAKLRKRVKELEQRLNVQRIQLQR